MNIKFVFRNKSGKYNLFFYHSGIPEQGSESCNAEEACIDQDACSAIDLMI